MNNVMLTASSAALIKDFIHCITVLQTMHSQWKFTLKSKAVLTAPSQAMNTATCACSTQLEGQAFCRASTQLLEEQAPWFESGTEKENPFV